MTELLSQIGGAALLGVGAAYFVENTVNPTISQSFHLRFAAIWILVSLFHLFHLLDLLDLSIFSYKIS